MDFLSVLLIAVGLAMDAFAVSVCKGLSMKKINISQMLIIAFMFGLFQCVMPILGYFLCIQFEEYIVSFDHWIAFGLLAFLGIKMIVEAFKEKEEVVVLGKSCEEEKNKIIKDKLESKLNFKELVVMAVATSIDALAVGITFAFFDFNIFLAGGIIGIVTFALCCGGVVIGFMFGTKFKKWAEVFGGAILILIGLKILLEHLGVLVL